MELVEEWPEVAEVEEKPVLGHRVITLRLTRGIRIRRSTDEAVLREEVSDVWTLVTGALGASGRYQTLIFAKDNYEVEEGDQSFMLVEEPKGSIRSQWENALVKLAFQTVEVGDVEVR